MKRLGSPLVVLLAGALLLTGCTAGSDGPSARSAADDLAKALTAGSLTGVAFSGGTPREAQRLWDDATDGMGEAKPSVRVEKVTEGEDAKPSTARLTYAWQLAPGTKPWTYRTVARLTRPGDDAEWRVRLEPALVHPRLQQGDRLRASTVAAQRGDITGAGGKALVTEREVLRFGIDKTQVAAGRQASSARRLANLVEIDPADFAARVRAAGPKAYVEAIVLRTADAQPVLRAATDSIPGLGVVRDLLPLAPTREFARPLLGTVGPVTAEIVKKSGGAYRAGDEAGLSGLEARYDEQLRGTPGVRVEAVDTDGKARELYRTEPTPGEPLATSIDARVQTVAERALSDVRPASALVALQPSTGAVLAAASGAGSGGLSTATVGQYAPGSTFKVVSSLALLRSGLSPTASVSCPATTVVDGKQFKNYDDYPSSALGRIPFSTAVANSCNTAFITERDAVSQAELADAAAALGLGVDHDLGFPAYFGSVPATEVEAGSETGHAASLIGQGKVTASPLAMAAVAASVAKGSTVVPRLLPEQSIDDEQPGAPLTAAEAKQLQALMRGVVTRGSAGFLAGLPGAPVLAKTGTAEFGDQQPLQTHAWMIAVQDDLAVAVFVDEGESGSSTAGPVLETFLRAVGPR